MVLTEMVSAVEVKDSAGRKIFMQNRLSAALIFPLSGQLRFIQNGCVTLADCRHPVFLPCGATYTNECLEDATSLMLNIHTAVAFESIYSLPAIPSEEIIRRFREIRATAALNLPETPLSVLVQLYALLEAMIRNERKHSPQELLFAQAIAQIERRFNDPTLTLHQIAAEISVSDSYLYKLFRQFAGKTPQAFLRQLRMNQAQALLLEAHSVTETAQAVGYGDIYAFSRAYKKSFGFPPSKSRQ